MSTAIAKAEAQGPGPSPEPKPDPLAVLEEHLRRDLALAPGVLGQVAREAVAAGGKRTRPRLVYLAHAACGGGREGLEACGAYATAVEYLHTATLLHDDLIDGATLRRGKPAAHRRFGPKEAVLSGDLLLARCLVHITGPGDPKAVSALAHAAERVAIGEAMEVELTRDPGVDRDRYLHYAASKTGALFAAALELGARAAGADEEKVDVLASFGEAVGLAFQIADDILDVVGDPARTGKTPGADLLAGVPSLPVVETLAVEGLDTAPVVELLRGEASDDTLPEALTLVAEHGVEPCVRRARALVDEARECLLTLPPSDARTELEAAASRAVERIA